MKNINFFYSFFYFLISVFLLPVYAETGEDSGNGIEPPPAAPIDNYVFIALILGILYAGYYFIRVNRSK